MKTLLLFNGQYGQFFFDDDKLVKYIHENDASYIEEYHGPILKWSGVELKVVKQLSLSPIQLAIVDRYEQ